MARAARRYVPLFAVHAFNKAKWSDDASAIDAFGADADDAASEPPAGGGGSAAPTSECGGEG